MATNYRAKPKQYQLTLIVVLTLCIITSWFIFYKTNPALDITSLSNNSNYVNIIDEYIKLPEQNSSGLILTKKSFDKQYNINIFSYVFNSQSWPKNTDNSPNFKSYTWSHKVNIYIPKNKTKNNTNKALLWINGGTNNSPHPDSTYPSYPLNFAELANKLNLIIIDLNDVPNQYIKLDNKNLAEDALIAHTWSKFLTNPEKYKYYSAYLPMVKSVIKTMDLTSKKYNIDSFILSGLSKRGMTTWLTALHDDRVSAIIPVAIDILNTKKTIKHIFNSHQNWPIALHDYYEHKILDQLNSKQVIRLLSINDPMHYIKCKDCETKLKNIYHKRASVDKLLILASGDDFFAPDSSLFYYDSLPDNKNLRFIPNSRHYINNKIVSDTLLSYVNIINNNNSTTKKQLYLDYKFINNNINLSLETKPLYIKLYKAHNHLKRDFRLSENINYNFININPNSFDTITNQQSGKYNYNINITPPKKGWNAFFVEVEYEQSENKNKIPNLKLTSPLEILPKTYPNGEFIQYG